MRSIRPYSIGRVEDYAEAVSTERGRCFRFIRDDYGRATQCPEPIITTGWLQIEREWNEVDSCRHHSAQLRKRGQFGSSASQPTCRLK